jgi:hypothetical protein
MHGWPDRDSTGALHCKSLNKRHTALQQKAACRSREHIMLIAFLTSLFAARPAYAWQPAIEIRDGATAAALGIYTRA